MDRRDWDVTDIGLDYIGNLTKLTDLYEGEDFTSAGILSLMKKRRTVLEEFKCVLYDAVDVLDSENEVLPNMKYLQCELSKLATVLRP